MLSSNVNGKVCFSFTKIVLKNLQSIFVADWSESELFLVISLARNTVQSVRGSGSIVTHNGYHRCTIVLFRQSGICHDAFLFIFKYL